MNFVQQYDIHYSLFSIDQFRVFKKRRRQLIAIKSNNIIVISIVIEQDFTMTLKNTTIETRRFVRQKK